MTPKIEVIRKKIGMMLWDAEMNPTITETGFLMNGNTIEIIINKI